MMEKGEKVVGGKRKMVVEGEKLVDGKRKMVKENRERKGVKKEGNGNVRQINYE